MTWIYGRWPACYQRWYEAQLLVTINVTVEHRTHVRTAYFNAALSLYHAQIDEGDAINTIGKETEVGVPQWGSQAN